MGKNCVICGKPSGMYPLCSEHLAMKSKGEVAKCEDCGTWYIIKEGCKCKKNEKSLIKHCLLCGEKIDGDYLFCKNCFFKYRDKTITVNIKNLSEFIIVDEYGNRNYKTASGLYVRSQQEKIIYDELFYRNIKVIYEPTVFYENEKGETKDLHPDFFLPDFNLYIEHWGYENTKDPKYLKIKDFKEKIYITEGKRVAGTSSEDILDIKSAIDRIFFENKIKL